MPDVFNYSILLDITYGCDKQSSLLLQRFPCRGRQDAGPGSVCNVNQSENFTKISNPKFQKWRIMLNCSFCRQISEIDTRSTSQADRAIDEIRYRRERTYRRYSNRESQKNRCFEPRIDPEALFLRRFATFLDTDFPIRTLSSEIVLNNLAKVNWR